MKDILGVVCVLGLMSVHDLADARQGRQNLVPNGLENSCGTCHVSPAGGGARNAFGVQVEPAFDDGNFDWADFYNLDADGDGYSNGEELGDPEGTWTDGAAGDYLSHPGVESRTPCGNGTIEGPEECDGADINDATCEAADFGTGTVACSSECTFDFSGCDGAPTNNINNTNGATNNANNTNGGGSNNVNTNGANNTNGVNNPVGSNNEPGNNDNNNSNGGDNNSDGPSTGGDSDDSGCTAVDSSASPLVLLFGVFMFMRRNRRRVSHAK